MFYHNYNGPKISQKPIFGLQARNSTDIIRTVNLNENKPSLL